MESKFLYMFILLLSIAGPLSYSFHKSIEFYKKWKKVLLAAALMMMLFIPWDIYFTYKGVWWFNEKYISGIKIFYLPFEEWGFFICIPFACVFLYEVLNFYLKKPILSMKARLLITSLGLILLLFSVLFLSKIYTSLTFALSGMTLLITAYKNPFWLGQFIRMYLISWIPFLVINGALTGMFTDEAVVNYNADEIIGLRIFTIPIEDSIYSLLMLLFVIWNYEYFLKRVIND